VAQTLKPELRAAILDAARDRFAAAGYRDAKMSDIAAAAGVSTGNLYRYFADRETLFAAAVPPELAERLLALVAQRVGSLAATPALADPDPAAREDGERFLAFLLSHRRETIVLLDGAAGSPFEAVRARFVDRLTAPLPCCSGWSSTTPSTPSSRSCGAAMTRRRSVARFTASGAINCPGSPVCSAGCHHDPGRHRHRRRAPRRRSRPRHGPRRRARPDRLRRRRAARDRRARTHAQLRARPAREHRGALVRTSGPQPWDRARSPTGSSGGAEPFTRALAERFLARGPGALGPALAAIHSAAAAYHGWAAGFDVSVCPTIPDLPPPIGTLSPVLDPDLLLRRTERLAGYTPVHNMAGVPAMSVPIGGSEEGLPIGIHFAGQAGADGLLLALALQLEQAAPWADRWP
jgi:AcrR family transcriptional regulator